MNSPPQRRLTGLAASIVVAGLLIGAAIYASSYLGPAKTVTKTTTTVSYVTLNEGPLSYTSGVSANGLELSVVLNSSSMQPKGAVGARVEVLNTLNQSVSLPVVTNQNLTAWNNEDFVCSDNPSVSLVGFGVFSGLFSQKNISAAGPPLQLAPPVLLPCAIALPVNETTFLPDSDATISSNGSQEPPYTVTAEVNATSGYCTGSGVSGHGGEIDCGANPGLVGYWNQNIAAGGNLNFTSPSFVYFSPGEYTIVATDAWNQYVYAYFTVV